MSVLQQPVLYLDVSVLQQSVLPSDVSVLQQSVLPFGHVCSTLACAALERVSSEAVCAVPGSVCVSVLRKSVQSLEVSGLQLLMLQLDVF